MKGKKGICLILCILLLLGLAPGRAFAVSGESVDGVWASIALTGGANKVLFSADDEIERQILHPDETTDAQYLLPDGAAYDAESNTLTLTDFDAPTANLVLTMMGADFKLRLVGSSRLGSIRSESKGRGGSLTVCGDGSLEISSSDAAILVLADGAPDFVRIEPQPHLNLFSASDSVIRVFGSTLSDGVILFDTSTPQLAARDLHQPITDVVTADGKTLDFYTIPGSGILYGVEWKAILDEEGEHFAYDIYLPEGPDADGLYTAGEPVEENVTDLSAYESVYTPHDWILVDLYSDTAAPQARFARFAINAQTLSENGTLSVSQTEVARGGSVELRAVPDEGYKLSSLTVNGEEVSAVNGSYLIGGITADQNIVADFAAAAPAEISVAAPADTDFSVPADGADAFVSEPFHATVTDGAGDPVGATVRWSVEPETEGVSIGEDGCVTVTNAAKRAAADPISFRVLASVEGTELTREGGGFTVSLAERKAAEIHLMRGGEPLEESDTLEIPAAGETTTQQYGAVVFDQYGSLREEEIEWSAGDWPLGVRRDGDTLTVTDECRDGSTLVVTARAASDSAVSVSVTVSFLEPEEEPEPEPDMDPDPDGEPDSDDKSGSEDKSDSSSEEGNGGGLLAAAPLRGGAPQLGAAPSAGEETSEDENKEDEQSADDSSSDEKGEEEPGITVSWPSFTLAPEEDRVYGIGWEALVRLGEDGSAQRGETPLEGSFSLSAESSLPNVSDSFRIVFSYLDDEETKSEKSEPYPVTLSRKAIDAGMITLSPAEIQYNYGNDCSPAVSLRDSHGGLVEGKDFRITGCTNKSEIGKGTITVEGLGNYSGEAEKDFQIVPIPVSALTGSITACKPEDEGIVPAIVFKHVDAQGTEHTLAEGRDYDVVLSYDVPAKTGTASLSFKGFYTGTRVLSFNLPNYLITEGAGSAWSKSSSDALSFRANGALVKFTDLTVDGRSVAASSYTLESGSTVVKIKAEYLRTLSTGKHIVGIAYKDGKALAIFSVSDPQRRGVATGDDSNVVLWIAVLAASLIAFGALSFAFLRGGRKKKKKKRSGK